MNNSTKSKAQLIIELEQMRKKVSDQEEKIHRFEQIEKEFATTKYLFKEHVKKLGCLYEVSKIVESEGASLDNILAGIVNLIPPACQYPDIACSKLSLNGKEYKTTIYKETDWQLHQDIFVQGEKAGWLVIGYLIQKTGADEEAFLKEERFLLDLLCERIGRIIERKRAEDALRRSEKDLRESQRIAHVGSWHLDVATNRVVWTEELYAMYGFDPSLPPPPYTEHMKLFTPESWERLSTALDHTKETGISNCKP